MRQYTAERGLAGWFFRVFLLRSTSLRLFFQLLRQLGLGLLRLLGLKLKFRRRLQANRTNSQGGELFQQRRLLGERF